jgi:hypothetical protein
MVARGFDTGDSIGAQMLFNPELSLYQITQSGLAAEASWGATAFVPDPFLKPRRPAEETAKPAGKPGEKDQE